jgi:SAM-dependent methyltransferase
MPSKFNKWLSFNLRYFWDTPWDTGVTPPELNEFIKNSTPGKALDLGAGTGTNIISLAKAGWEAVGIEYALAAVFSARRKIKREGVDAKIYLRDVTNLNFLTMEFDLVLDIGCFHSLNSNEKLRYRKNLYRLLKPGGIFMIYGFQKKEDENRSGISETDIDHFSRMLNLFSLDQGTERGLRDSIWLKFQKARDSLAML